MYLMQPYDDALVKILKEGSRQKNRTGVDTIAVFGLQSRYRLNERFPLVNRRAIAFRPIFGELLTFIAGKTNNSDFIKNNCSYWSPWVSPAFEKEHGFASGSFGPTYGFQLRHFDGFYGNGIGGATYTENSTIEASTHCPEPYNAYGASGYDQLQEVVRKLKQDKDSRRNIFSLWNPNDISRMKLPPCAWAAQFLVGKNDQLTCILIQRSCDFPVGVPANIAFYAAFTMMLAQQCDLEAYELVHWTADSHVYVNQIPGVEEYLARPEPSHSPRLCLEKADDIESYTQNHWELGDYVSLGQIKFPVAV